MNRLYLLFTAYHPMSNLKANLEEYNKLCTELQRIKDDMTECDYEKKVIQDEYKAVLLKDKEFEVLQYSYTSEGKKYLESLSQDMQNGIVAERKALEDKMNRIVEDCVNQMFVLRTEQYNNLKSQYDLLQQRKADVLVIIKKFGAFDVVTGGKRYIQTVDKNKKTYTKKNLITAFVGIKSHHKWKSVKEFEEDWSKYFGKDSKTLSYGSITESRKRDRDTGDDMDENNPSKK
jgi:hypothetical protein